MYGCESWTIMKAERQRIGAFELWCWRRLFRVPWTARRSNQSILKEISPGCSLEGPMLKLKVGYFGHLMQRIDSFEKILLLGKIEGGRKRRRQRMRWLDESSTQWTRVWAELRKTVKDREAWCAASMGSHRVSQDWVAEQQYLFKKRKVRTVLDTRALHGPLSNTSRCADPLETPTDHPGLCPLKSRKPGPLGSVLLFWSQFKSHHLRAIISSDRPSQVSSFPPPLLYHGSHFHSFSFTIMISSSLAYSFKDFLFPPLRMKQGPWLVNKQKGIPKT